MAALLHVDMDMFIAAVEIRRRPELRGLPVAVGGSGDAEMRRQVVASASYEARAMGVHSGMPLRAAVRKCPDLVVVPKDDPAYDAASTEVMDVLRSFGQPVEVLGWDEAFVGATGEDPEELAARIRVAVRERTGLSCQVGVGDTRVRAKLATGFAKEGGPDVGGVARLDAANWDELMGHRPTTALWGIGARTAKHLDEMGLRTVAELAAVDEDVLAKRFGPTNGPWLRTLAVGGDSAGVFPEPREPRGRSHQVTFAEDLTKPEQLQREVTAIAHALTAEVVADGRTIMRVFVTVRTSSFFTRTLGSKLAEPTTDPDVVTATALRVLERFEVRKPVRLLGVRAEFPR
jgi:DNA polymerase IV